MNKHKQFIKDAYNGKLGLDMCGEWKEAIEKKFPKLIKGTELVAGKWYKHPMGGLWFIETITKEQLFIYGFDIGYDWIEKQSVRGKITGLAPATDQEVETALIKEAKRRGFKEGVRFNNAYKKTLKPINTGLVYSIEFDANIFKGGGIFTCNQWIFCEGNWATILETITKEDAEKQLGKTII